jgi:hypothetical protein
MIGAIARKYIELALREKIASERPDYWKKTIDAVVTASIGTDFAHVSKEVLYRAIELAAEERGLNEPDIVCE